MHDYEFRTNYDEMFANLVKGGVKYLERNEGVETLVLGLSGGIDSFVTAALAYEVKNRLERDIKTVGYSLPLVTNDGDEVARARLTGDLCTHFAEVDLSGTFFPLVEGVDNSLFHEMEGKVSKNVPFDTKIRVGNLKARLRMMYLYDKASKYKGMVLSTDNFTEYLLGFWTLHGDVGDFGFVQELWKTEVYGLAEYIRDSAIAPEAAEACINANPTDGLGIADGDLSQLLPDWKGPHREGYRTVDEILMSYLIAEERMDYDAAITQKMLSDSPVMVRHFASEFKRDNPHNLSRQRVLGLL